MKKTRFLSLLIVAVMLFTMIPAVVASADGTAPQMPTALPDLKGAGIGITGWHYVPGDNAVFAHHLAKPTGCPGIHGTGDFCQGYLSNDKAANTQGVVLMPMNTQGAAFTTQNVFTGELAATKTNSDYKTIENFTAMKLPENTVGVMVLIDAPVGAYTDIRINPVFNFTDGTTLRTVKGSGSYAYYWDTSATASGAWACTPCEHAYRVPCGTAYIYMPLETWQMTKNGTNYSNPADPHLTFDAVKDLQLTNFEFSTAWTDAGFKVKSVDLVILDTSDTDEWDGTADTSWFDENNIQTEYYLDTAEKVAGLAKIVKDKATANFPYEAAGNKLVTFYITKNLDLKDMEWLPIGNTYANRFGGSIVGALGGDKNVPITISNMKISNNGDNTGFIGTIDGVEKTTGTVVKNLNFVNANVTNPTDTCNAIVVGYARSGGLFENITVTGSTLSNAAEQGGGASWHGGIVAYSKYGSPIRFKNCVFDGTINLAGTTQTVGAIIGEATVGAALDGCYVGGEIITSASCNNVGGMVGMVKEADKPLAIQNSQMNANISVGVDSGAGAFVGSATNATVAKSIYTGVGFYKNGTSATVLPLLGAGTLTATDIYTRIKVANATQKGKELLGDTAKTTLTGFDFEATWTVRAGMVPVLTVAKDIATKAYANADLTWYDPAKTEMGIASFEQLVGLTYIGRYDPFAEKTVKLTADIDGSAKIEGQETLVLGRQEEGGVNCIFLGTYDKGAFDITNVEFERLMAEGKFLITWIVGNQTFEEEYSYGETPVFKGSTDRADDKKYTYEFTGWDPVIVPVTGPATYDAIWLPVKKEEATTAPETEEITEPATEADTTPAEKEGCGAAMTSFAVIAVMAMAASGVALFKKKKED